ncbi:GntR family transcriptional regulator [Paenibacillus allorhizosphaerae]|uniref:Arabinose metabolism transcriptional repressor n=1 Tax=Paenibacillus allorhizosphaerae TaxID=2849866 RepID=A0ABM8VI03_9BACL|nr:GntR family transcriptional regulator [Paenibacillus allorhizosphaerae]CAG7643345.1 Arabinose metabolism transcriptional repressor [Paenibacillus allorhizosphaerae]
MNEKTKPKHEQVKEMILSWIESERYKPNDQLPTEHELSELSGTSRQTVRQALGTLVQEGRLYRKQGSGTYVAALSERRTADMPTIGVLTTYISDYIFPQIVRGAESVLREQGCLMLLSSTDNDKAKERDNLLMLQAGPLQGLIIEPTKSAQGNPNLDCYLALEYMKIPYLMINERYAELDCPCVKVDDELGGYLAAKHLIELGHFRIAGFFKTDDLQGTQRLKGFLRAHREFGVQLRPEHVVHYATENKETRPFELALTMLEKPEERPTAIVCYNDELAVRLLEAVRRTELRVPEDVSMIGFDDSFLATATEVKLTSVSHPKAELGMKAAELLIAMMEGSAPSRNRDIIFAPDIVLRDSTKPYEKNGDKFVRTNV